MGFRGRFFIALLAVCVAKGAWAQCCWCEQSDGCLVGQEPYDGQCVGDWGDCCLCYDDCEYICGPGGPYCDTFQDQCPSGLGGEYRCKVIDQDCGSGCKKYKTCDSTNGNVGPDVVSENCHIENNTCYSNTRACSDFSSSVYNFGQVTCSTQNGNAVWNSGKWNVSGCSCDVPSVSNNLNNYFRCTQFGTHVGLYPNQNVQSVDDSILYMVDRLYCEKCPAGYLPTITDASSGDIYARPENTSGNWGVITCGIQVQAPYYSDGCVIDFNLSTDDMMAECRKQCPDGFETEAPGATNVEDCQYDGHTTYTDETGTFYIGSLDDCP